MSLAAYTFVERAPTLSEYRTLCTAVGWEAVINFEAAPHSLDHSLYHVLVLYQGQAIGMGRIVGDGAMYFYLQDIAVHPDHQHQGVGRRIVEHLVGYLAVRAPAQAFIGLFAAQGTERWYAQFGFQVYAALTGMFQVTPLPSIAPSSPETEA